MTPDEYTQHRQRTANTESVTWQDQLLNVALGLGESGELQNLVKKHIYHGHPIENLVEKMIDEAGDIYYYLDWLAELLGTTPAEIQQHNVEKLSLRYPTGWDSERSINRE